MTALSAPSLTGLLRQLQSRLSLESPPDLLNKLLSIKRAFPIEWAESKASAKQLAFQKNFFDRADDTGRRCDIFVALGGNRSGKSIGAGRLCFAKYLRDYARDGDCFWCVGVTLDRSILGQQQELWQALPRWMFGPEQVWSEKIGFGMHRKITLPTSDGGKCLVEFRSADQNPSTFEQAKLAGVWCDERLPEEIYDRLLPRIIDRGGWILYSDIPEQWWQMERLVNAKAEAGVLFQLFTMHDNAHNLPDGAIATTMARMTADQIRQRIKGEFCIMEGLVYREYSDERHVVPAGAFPGGIPADWPKWRAIDYGASAPTACLWMTIAPNECAYVYREYYQANLSVDKNAKAILAMSGNERYTKTLIDPHAYDPPPITYGASKTIAQQYADAGVFATGWPFVQVMGEHAMVQRVKFRLENDTLRVFEGCVNLRREFRSWKYVTDKEGKPKAQDAFENDRNHALDCVKAWLGTSPCFTQQRVKIAGYGG